MSVKDIPVEKMTIERLRVELTSALAANKLLCNRDSQLQAQLAAVEQQIGWLQDDKVRLNRSIKLRNNAMDAMIDMDEKENKRLQSQLAKANKEIKRLKCANLPVQGYGRQT